jgi:hypothetical protein
MILNPYVYGSKIPEVGDFFDGGVVFYIFQSGDLGYVPGETHGIICAITDQSSGIQWFNGTYIRMYNSVAIGVGKTNTEKIITNQGAGSYAATACTGYNGGGYVDWFLPSRYELEQIYVNKEIINTTATANGGQDLTTDNYWSSSDVSQNSAILVNISSGAYSNASKSGTYRVRAVRYF